MSIRNDFNPSAYSVGTVNGQVGWSAPPGIVVGKNFRDPPRDLSNGMGIATANQRGRASKSAFLGVKNRVEWFFSAEIIANAAGSVDVGLGTDLNQDSKIANNEIGMRVLCQQRSCLLEINKQTLPFMLDATSWSWVEVYVDLVGAQGRGHVTVRYQKWPFTLSGTPWVDTVLTRHPVLFPLQDPAGAGKVAKNPLAWDMLFVSLAEKDSAVDNVIVTQKLNNAPNYQIPVFVETTMPPMLTPAPPIVGAPPTVPPPANPANPTNPINPTNPPSSMMPGTVAGMMSMMAAVTGGGDSDNIFGQWWLWLVVTLFCCCMCCIVVALIVWNIQDGGNDKKVTVASEGTPNPTQGEGETYGTLSLVPHSDPLHANDSAGSVGTHAFNSQYGTAPRQSSTGSFVANTYGPSPMESVASASVYGPSTVNEDDTDQLYLPSPGRPSQQEPSLMW